MVLPLKRWKSRASPGIAAGAHDISDFEQNLRILRLRNRGNKQSVHWKNPFIIQKADRCRSFDGCPPFFVFVLLKYGTFWWRGMEQPASVLRKQNGKQKKLPGDKNVASLVARDGAAR